MGSITSAATSEEGPLDETYRCGLGTLRCVALVVRMHDSLTRAAASSMFEQQNRRGFFRLNLFSPRNQSVRLRGFPF